MKHASLFSGIGGFDLAAQWMGWENVFQVEIEPFCQKVLEKNFPTTKRYGDIKQFDGTEYSGAIDILTGGFPCQPFSKGGKRAGTDDDRYLWPQMLRVIREVRPQFIVAENVANLIKMGIEYMFDDLANSGYTTEIFIIPACAVKALHRRDRVWICAHSNKNAISHHTRKIRAAPSENESKTQRKDGKWGGTEFSAICNEQNWIEVATRICGIDNGLPGRMDRIGSVGNAIQPQVAYEIFKAIELIESKRVTKN
jgi:DNA (cytosine-5)-methyltransferase 1